MYYDKEGNQIDVLKWGELFGDLSYRVIKHDEVGQFRISTIWLGMDYSIFDHKLIFETMVFCSNKDHILHNELERCSTLQTAEMIHDHFVKEISRIHSGEMSAEDFCPFYERNKEDQL